MLGLMHGLYAQARQNLGYNGTPWMIGALGDGRCPGPVVATRQYTCFICTEVMSLRAKVSLRMSTPYQQMTAWRCNLSPWQRAQLCPDEPVPFMPWPPSARNPLQSTDHVPVVNDSPDRQAKVNDQGPFRDALARGPESVFAVMAGKAGLFDGMRTAQGTPGNGMVAGERCRPQRCYRNVGCMGQHLEDECPARPTGTALDILEQAAKAKPENYRRAGKLPELAADFAQDPMGAGTKDPYAEVADKLFTTAAALRR